MMSPGYFLMFVLTLILGEGVDEVVGSELCVYVCMCIYRCVFVCAHPCEYTLKGPLRPGVG